MFPEATFIEEHAFRELKQGLEEISIPCRTVSFQRNGEFAWWIWRNYYAGNMWITLTCPNRGLKQPDWMLPGRIQRWQYKPFFRIGIGWFQLKPTSIQLTVVWAGLWKRDGYGNARKHTSSG